MKRSLALLVLPALAVAACSSGSTVAKDTSTGHVSQGTPVVARFNPTNNIVTAVKAGASQVGLGAVSAVGYKKSCAPEQNAVIVCRNASYTNGQTSTDSTATTCVVELDPKLGGGSRTYRVTDALRKCIQ